VPPSCGGAASPGIGADLIRRGARATTPTQGLWFMFGMVSMIRLIFPWMLVDEGVYEMINCILHFFAKVRATARVGARATCLFSRSICLTFGSRANREALLFACVARRSRSRGAGIGAGVGWVAWQFAFTHLLCHDFCLSVTERTMMSVRKKEQENKTVMLDKMQEVRTRPIHMTAPISCDERGPSERLVLER